METKVYCSEYAAPEINVVKLKSQGILCLSEGELAGHTTEMGDEKW